ncbi:hypothetical protein FB451DRAFT_1179046 [Mycena latifolia]|nr:hypothetical protein FB451DRAFT_1179046 [Mycena latifolia]
MSPLALPADVQGDSNLAPSIQTHQFSSLTAIKISVVKANNDSYESRDEVKNFGSACLFGAGQVARTSKKVGGALAGLRMSSVFLCGVETQVNARTSYTSQPSQIQTPLGALKKNGLILRGTEVVFRSCWRRRRVVQAMPPSRKHEKGSKDRKHNTNQESRGKQESEEVLKYARAHAMSDRMENNWVGDGMSRNLDM